MSTDTNVKQVILNKLTKAQYDAAEKVATELYLTPDDPASTTNLGPVMVDGVTIRASSDGVIAVDQTQLTTKQNSLSNMSVTEGTTGTATTQRSVRADYLKQIINYYIDEQPVVTGPDSEDDGTKGLVPAPLVGDETKFLRGDGTWADVNNSIKIDNKSITTNGSSQIQAVGVIDQNNTNNAVKTWTGTRQQFDLIQNKDSNTLYNITDDESNATTSLLEMLYPIGSIYISTNTVCPLSVLINGSIWELVSSGRVLQGADSNHSAGTTIEAGLPNIKGNLTVFDGAGASKKWAPGCTVTGAFVKNNLDRDAVITGSAVNFDDSFDLGIDASQSNSIYSDNVTTVQPSAYVVNIFRRTA